MAERITERPLCVRGGGRVDVLGCPRGKAHAVSCGYCVDWRWFGMPAAYQGPGLVVLPVGIDGTLAPHTRCAHPVPCSECGRDCDCGKGES